MLVIAHDRMPLMSSPELNPVLATMDLEIECRILKPLTEIIQDAARPFSSE